MSGLASATDAAFSLTTNVPVGPETTDASTDARQIYDLANNVTFAGPIVGHMIDKKAPLTTIVSPAARVYALNERIVTNYSCVDGGSGVASCDGPVDSGAALVTSVVGAQDFVVDAEGRVGTRRVQYGPIPCRSTCACSMTPRKRGPQAGRFP